MRFHVLGLAHLPVARAYAGCAFTTKTFRLCHMLLSLGHEVILYGAESSDAECSEFVQTHTLDDIRKAWGDGDNRFDLGYNWQRWGFRHDFNGPRTETTRRYYQACIDGINARRRADDFLLLGQGCYQKPIADGVNLWLTCEPGVGYRGSYTRFRAFESAYLQNFTYGSAHPYESINGNYYDRVIPNYFDLADFPFQAEPDPSRYYLFVGRMVMRKGLWTAYKTVKALGGRLILAGQGDPHRECGIPRDDWVRFVGYIEPEERAALMGGALATFVPTIYLEAFGGVNVESQLCGTPVLTTNFGVFPETVAQGVSGYRCDTLQDFVDGARAAPGLDRAIVRRQALRYDMENVKHEFEGWFRDLHQLWRSAHEPGVQGWHHVRAGDA